MIAPTMDRIALTPEMMTPTGQGRFCRVIHNKAVAHLLAERYGRPGLCLKVLRSAGETWEGRPMVEASRLQNIGAAHGVAPRVYDLVRLPDGALAQVTDYVAMGEPSPAAVERLTQFLRELGVATAKKVGPGGPPKWDIVTSVRNWGGDLFLDWGGLYLSDPDAYLRQLAQRAAVRITQVGRGEPASATYQPLSELGLQGSRDTAHRIKAMRLEEIDWRGKTVLDLGCNLGAFCRYADKRGARRVVGVELAMLARADREIANWLGHWNVDFAAAQLPGEVAWIGKHTGLQRFDVVLALSICNHVGGYGSWMAELTSDLLILEGHGGDPAERYAEDLKRDFRRVEMVGYTIDRMRRPVFICRK